MKNLTKEELIRKCRSLEKKTEHYKTIADKVGSICLRETEDLSALIQKHRDAASELREIKKKLKYRIKEKTDELISTNKELTLEIQMRGMAEMALRASEERFRNFFKNANTGMTMLDLSGQFTHMNPCFCKMIGYEQDELLGKRHIYVMHPGEIPEYLNILEDMLAGKITALRRSQRYRHKKGHVIWANLNLSLVWDEKGTPLNFIAQVMDITQKVQAEDELKRMKDSLEILVEKRTEALRETNIRLQKEMDERVLLQGHLIRSERLAAAGQLSASIAHEINSPLQGITSLLHVMEKTYPGDLWLQENIGLLKMAYDNIGSTVKNLLDLNRPGMDKKQEISVNSIIRKTISLVQIFLKGEKISVHLSLSRDTDPAILFGSPQQIGQVFLNLINNAVEIMTGVARNSEGQIPCKPGNQGQIMIRTKREKNLIVIEIEDTGPGISEKAREHIFDPFYTRKKTMGMGVGLSICHGIVEEHGGSIAAANRPGSGAVFTISLPVSTRIPATTRPAKPL